MRRAAWVPALVAALALTACSKPEPSSAPAPPDAPATEAPGDDEFRTVVFDVHAVDAGSDQVDSARSKITALLNGYLSGAMLEPLRSGQPAGDLSDLFTAAAADRLKGPERAALVDEGLPKADDLQVQEALAGVALLATGPGSGVAVAAVRVQLTARVGSTPLGILRGAELILSAEGDDWKIQGFDVAVTRDAPAGTTTTTAAS